VKFLTLILFIKIWC